MSTDRPLEEYPPLAAKIIKRHRRLTMMATGRTDASSTIRDDVDIDDDSILPSKVLRNTRKCHRRAMMTASTDVTSTTSEDGDDDKGPVEVSERMLPSQALRSNLESLYRIPLTQLNCSFGTVTEAPTDRPLRYCVKKQARMVQADVAVVFVVRRPGCNSCREHAEQLVQCLQHDGVSLWAIVKETGVEEQGILEFYEDHFHYPIYKDAKWLTYRAMGDRRITPTKLLKRAFKAYGRWKKKGIPNRIKGGDIWVQGGVLLFDRKRRLRYAYEEEYGKEFEMDDIRRAIKAIRTDDAGSEATYTEAVSEALSVDRELVIL